MEKSIISNVTVPILASLGQNIGMYFDATVTVQFQRIANLVFVEGDVITWPSPCGPDCSYVISFVGPAHQCLDLGPLSSVDVNLTEIADNQPFSSAEPGLLSPPVLDDSVWYYALVDAGNETTPIGLWVVYDSLNHTIRC